MQGLTVNEHDALGQLLSQVREDVSHAAHIQATLRRLWRRVTGVGRESFVTAQTTQVSRTLTMLGQEDKEFAATL